MSHRPFPSTSGLRRRAPRFAAVAVVGLALGLSACGSSDSSSTQASAAPGQGQGQNGGPGRFAQDPKVAACLKKAGVTLPTFRGRGQGRPGGPPPTGTSTNAVPPAGTSTNAAPPTGTTTNGAPPASGDRPRRPPNGQRPNFDSAQFQKMQAALKKCGVTVGQRRPGGPGGNGNGSGGYGGGNGGYGNGQAPQTTTPGSAS